MKGKVLIAMSYFSQLRSLKFHLDCWFVHSSIAIERPLCTGSVRRQGVVERQTEFSPSRSLW